MLRNVLWTLRQRRYATLAAAMLVLALGCVWAGTWQIQRFRQSVHDNHALNHNARTATVALSSIDVALTGSGHAPGRDSIRYRTVTATGSYLDVVGYLGGKVISGNGGYYVVSPLRTDAGVVLVIRGFVADQNGHPGTVPSVPRGQVSITGRLDTATTEAAGNPTSAARALGAAVYQAVLKLLPTQPGGAGLVAVPKPDLSNPAGGAYEAQHFAYIVQWYVFALLALVAPFLLARNEVRDAQRRFLGVDTGDAELGEGVAVALESAQPSGALAVRPDGAVARAGVDQPAELARAQRLADRYGRALSAGTEAPATTRRSRRRTPSPVGGLTERVPNSADAPHRSHDGYHGSYNDYLWQLGLADGASTIAVEQAESAAIETGERSKAIEGVVIDVDVDKRD